MRLQCQRKTQVFLAISICMLVGMSTGEAPLSGVVVHAEDGTKMVHPQLLRNVTEERDSKRWKQAPAPVVNLGEVCDGSSSSSSSCSCSGAARSKVYSLHNASRWQED